VIGNQDGYNFHDTISNHDKLTISPLAHALTSRVKFVSLSQLKYIYIAKDDLSCPSFCSILTLTLIMSSLHTQTVLITAAGGNIGYALVPKLLQYDFKLVLPTSDAARLQSKLTATTSSDRVTIESGSIKNAQWVQSILSKHAVDVVFMCLTGNDEHFTTLNFLDAMQRAGHVKQLIYLSACGDFVSAKGVEETMRAHNAAHVLVKNIIEQKLIYGAFLWKTTRLGPLLFVSNDLRSKNSMLKDGLFDEPLGEVGVGRVFESDIALAACNAILSPDRWTGKKVNIGSLRRYKGSEVAEMWSHAIGRTVRMCGSDDDSLLTLEDRVEAHIGQGDSSGWGRDLRLMYEAFSRVGFGMTHDQYELQIELLGKEPEDYAKWVEETGKSWRQD
jgi:nucleoside-diphosphate-sugar epimerase